jgi:hypothetical protein
LDGAVISAVSQLCLHGNEVDNFHMKMVVAICTQVFAKRKQNIEKLPNEKKRKRTGGREKGIEGEREKTRAELSQVTLFPYTQGQIHTMQVFLEFLVEENNHRRQAFLLVRQIPQTTANT